jgi:hypothetical protein
MPSTHNYKHSSGYCFGPNNQNGVFGPSSNDPKVLRDHLNIVLSSKSLGWFANGHSETDCEPDVQDKVCDITTLPIILTVGPLDYTTCVANIVAAFGASFNGQIIVQPTFLEKFLKLLELVSTPAQLYGPICPTDTFELRVIFDDKVSISWGELTNSGLGYIRDTSPLNFPVTFTVFEIIVYSTTTNTHYTSTLRYSAL